MGSFKIIFCFQNYFFPKDFMKNTSRKILFCFFFDFTNYFLMKNSWQKELQIHPLIARLVSYEMEIGELEDYTDFINLTQETGKLFQKLAQRKQLMINQYFSG